MRIDFGKVKPGSVLPIPFFTYDSNDPAASVIVSDFVVGDIEIYKDFGLTQRASTNGYTLIDTDGINIESVTGFHGFTIDLSDNTTANFYVSGSHYFIMVGPITVDAGAVVFCAATFYIGYDSAILDANIATLASQTSFTITNPPTDDGSLIGCTCLVTDIATKAQTAIGVVSNYTTAANTITLAADPAVFTMAAGDHISFFMPTNVKAISDDITAANNLELMYDTTGYTDATAPASRSQVDGIGAGGGGGLNFAVTSDNTSTAIKTVDSVGTPTGTFANLQAEDGSVHSIAHATNDIDWIYGFTVGGGRTAVEVDFAGRLNSANDAMLIQAFDFVGADWETIVQLPGQGGSSNITLIGALLSKHTGTGADLGNVFVRFEADGAMTSPTLTVDKLLVEAVNIGQSVGYANGRIYINTNASNTNTESFVDGTADNPVSTIAAAKTLSTQLGIVDFHVVNGSSFTLAENTDNESYFGDNWTLGLGAQSIAGANFVGATVSGTSTGKNASFEDCDVRATSVDESVFLRCQMGSTLTLIATGNYDLVDCSAQLISGSGPVLDLASLGGAVMNYRRYSGGLTVNNFAAGDICGIELVSGGPFTFNGVDGTATIKGMASAYTDNRTGSNIKLFTTALVKNVLPASNRALSDIEFNMVDASDFATPKTGLTVTGERSIDGGAYASVTGAIAEVGSGTYQFDAAADDMNGVIITFKFTATGAADSFLTIRTSR